MIIDTYIDRMSYPFEIAPTKIGTILDVACASEIHIPPNILSISNVAYDKLFNYCEHLIIEKEFPDGLID